jgi:hypothetical protein
MSTGENFGDFEIFFAGTASDESRGTRETIMERKIGGVAAVGAAKEMAGRVHCFICTHYVPAVVEKRGQKLMTKPGQNCPRCHSSLDSAYAMLLAHAS